MSRRERPLKAVQILQETLRASTPTNDGARAQAIRDLCPCRGEQRSAELWEVILVAYEDPSSEVRLEALHAFYFSHRLLQWSSVNCTTSCLTISLICV